MRAKILLGCYRTGDANDPETYVAAVTAVLSHYPEEVITAVTHPVSGLPSKKGWLPTIKEVTEACAAAAEPIAQEEARLKRIKEQMEARARMDRGEKPTLAQIKERFGENYGLKHLENEKTAEQKAEENEAALRNALARVRQEYQEAGINVPSKFALSIEARRLIAQQNEERSGMVSEAEAS
jgi:hypothetical protein